MLKTLKKYFEAQERLANAAQLAPSPSINRSPTSKAGNRRVEILDAVNGKVLEIAHRKSIQHDWEVTLYVVREDESLADAIATALCVTGGT